MSPPNFRRKPGFSFPGTGTARRPRNISERRISASDSATRTCGAPSMPMRFTVAKMMQLDLLYDMQSALASALEEGPDLSAVRAGGDAADAGHGMVGTPGEDRSQDGEDPPRATGEPSAAADYLPSQHAFCPSCGTVAQDTAHQRDSPLSALSVGSQ